MIAIKPKLAFLLCSTIASVIVVGSALLQGMPDPDHYLVYAEKYAAAMFDGAALPDAYRPPLYPLLLAPIVRFAPMPEWWIGALHVALSIATLAAVWRLAVQHSRLAATAACLIVAVDPILAFQSGQIMTETLFTTLVIWSLLPWLNQLAPSRTSTIISGILAGMALLTRPTLVPLFAAVGVALLIQRRKQEFQSWLLAAFVVLIVALPWAIRNHMLLGSPLFTTTHGGYTLWLANNPSFYEVEVKGGRNWGGSTEFDRWQQSNQELTTGLQEVEKDEAYRRVAIEWIRENIDAAKQAALYRLSMFWGLTPRSGPELLRPLIGVYHGVFLVLAAIGWFALKSWRGPWLTATLVVVALSLVHTVYWSNMRFAGAIEPLLSVWAAASIDWLVRRVCPTTNDI